MKGYWRNKKILSVVGNHLVEYPVSSNLSYLWSLGSISGICLVVQIISGILLGMHYCGDIMKAFDSVEHIMREVNMGWMLRYVHCNGASMFFIVVYIHVFRGLYYGSYVRPRSLLWYVGIVIMLLMIITGFIGYVLPWGQMSLWGATVITNLVSAIPFVGVNIVEWIWGGFSVGNATLTRFYSLHFMLPFILSGLAGYHLVVLHLNGSSNKFGIELGDKMDFFPYCYIKDLLGFTGNVLMMGLLVLYIPNVLGHPDNYIIANSMVTPEHIVPEWYFLPFYAILRTIEHKLGGVVLMMGAILILGILPIIIVDIIRGSISNLNYNIAIVCFINTSLLLGFIGQAPVELPYSVTGLSLSRVYFVLLLGVLPLVSVIGSLKIKKVN